MIQELAESLASLQDTLWSRLFVSLRWRPLLCLLSQLGLHTVPRGEVFWVHRACKIVWLSWNTLLLLSEITLRSGFEQDFVIFVTHIIVRYVYHNIFLPLINRRANKFWMQVSEWHIKSWHLYSILLCLCERYPLSIATLDKVVCFWFL